MPATPDFSRGYPPRVTELARRMRDNGYGINEIREALTKYGFYPPRKTVRYWIDEEYREDTLRAKRNFRPKGPARRRGWRLRLERMEALRETGISYADVAAVMSLDYEDFGLDGEQVRRIFNGILNPRNALAVKK